MLLMPVPADRFDEIRRKWIARNQRTFIFQKRRAEILARQIRDRDTELTGARVDPADDDVIHPWYARPIKTPYAMFDWVIFMTAAVLAPLGWPAGKALSVSVVQLIPSELRSYPIAAFMWSAAVVGAAVAAAAVADRPGGFLGVGGSGAVAGGPNPGGAADRGHLRDLGRLAGRRRGPRLVADAPTR